MKRLLMALALTAICTSSFGQEAVSRRSTITMGPYLQAVTDHSFTVVWVTDRDATGWVEIAPDDSTHFYQKERERIYDLTYGKKTIAKIHKVTVDGLEKGTTYRYRAMNRGAEWMDDGKTVVMGSESGNDPYRTKPFSVTTLDPDAESCNFCIVNDIHGDNKTFRALMKPIKKDTMDFVILNGDMLSSTLNEKTMFDGYLRSACELFASDIPFYYVRGNHENRGSYSYNFIKYFPTTTGEMYYIVRQGPVAFLMLDCGEDNPDDAMLHMDLIMCDVYRQQEAKWLEKAVECEEFKSAPYKIVILHMPPSQSKHGTIINGKLFLPILEKADIDLMLSGHVHYYSFCEKGERGTSFPVITNGAKEKHYFRITKDGIYGERRDASNKVLRTYNITK